MKIRVIKSNPLNGQEHINYLLGEVFDIVPYREFDKDTREEMKRLGEVAIRTGQGKFNQYILNKSEYEIIE